MRPDRVRILNIDVHNWRFNEFIEQLDTGVVVTVNMDHLRNLHCDEAFYRQYVKAEHIVCDSRILQLLSRILDSSNPVVEQIAGADLLPAYCHYHSNNTDKVKVFLLGGSPESVELCGKRINERTNSQIIVGGYSPPSGFESSDAELQKIIAKVSASGATALAVGVGSPKQENWIFEHRADLPDVKLFFAIGAAIEYQAGALKRAPYWIRRAGGEWLYRLLHEPGRLASRYLIYDPPVCWMIIRQRLGSYQDPWKIRER